MNLQEVCGECDRAAMQWAFSELVNEFTWSKFRKRPLVIDAVPILQETLVPTLEGTVIGRPGEWLIRGIAGEYYVCQGDIFESTYEPA